MTAAVSIARYLLDEASSDTAITTVLDDEGTTNLTMYYGTSDAQWSSIGAGNALEFLDATGTASADSASMDTTTLGTSLVDSTEVSILCRIDADSGNAGGGRIFHIGGGNGDLTVNVNGTSSLSVRWRNDQTLGGEVYYSSVTGSITTVAIVIDVTQATAADRCKLYLDGSSTPETATSGTFPQNGALSLVDDVSRFFTIGNRGDDARGMAARLYYLELFTGQLTTTQIADSHTALVANNDANWIATAAAITSVGDDDVVLDAEQNVSFVTSGFSGEISTVQLVSGTSITTINPASINSTGGSGDFDLIDISALISPTVGAPLTTANNVVVARLTDA